jgi:hypothetical protein
MRRGADARTCALNETLGIAMEQPSPPTNSHGLAMQTAFSSWREKLATGLGPYVASGVILAFFIRFVLPACRAHFAPDDMLNIYYYWSRGPLQLTKGLLLFASSYYRPMGGVFYSVLYSLYGLNPLPYHITISGLIIVNSYLAYRFAFLISDSPLVGAATALLTTYHSNLASLVYWPSFVYDVLCFTFFFSALNYYISIRQNGRLLTKRQMLIFTALYVCALESKEMAVSLPLGVMLYELLWHAPARRSWKCVHHWFFHEGLASLIAAALTLVYVVGKTSGSGALVRNELYKPLFSWHRFAESNVLYLNTLFYRSPREGFTVFTLIASWLALFCIAWRRREKHVWLMAFFVVFAPLPIAFLPPRVAGRVYIPLVGWAIILSTLYLGLATLLKNLPPLHRVSLQQLRVALALIAIPCIWTVNKHADRSSLPWMYARGELTWSFLQQLRAANLPLKPNSEIVFLNDPFSDGPSARWNALFITELFYHDHTIKVLLARMMPVSSGRIAAADLVLTWKDGRLMRVGSSLSSEEPFCATVAQRGLR